MRIGAVVEIAPDGSGQLPDDLITEAYGASRATVIAFVLDAAVQRSDVDRVLDPVVAANCGNVHGVLYLDHADEATIHAALQRAQFVVATTDEFRARCTVGGVTSLTWPAARASLASLTERRRAFVPTLRTGAELQGVMR